ncbi:chemotaxis protein CheW [Iningainema tapete]|uniref:Chemotaxis protein CheW n=1 Tax=Iningainema tapete BLCC-T55 TaxID=2748662 RepID=A0A8J7CG51_9CYAN|nr:chemotaxis protein CheW [Iningainema tapete]MBD2775890.1 chemotaxis protein CheW [Iningainema tapete BLCC-T55]
MDKESKVSKFIVFKIGENLIALLVSDVIKVVDCYAIATRQTTMGLVQLGKHIIKLLDLHQQLSSGDLPQQCNQPILVITRNSQGELCGISVDEPPDLLELPLEFFRLLPQSFRYEKPGNEMLSHVAVISHKEVTKTIFLLDIKGTISLWNQHQLAE